MSAGFSPEANEAIQRVFDDPAQGQLAERIEEVLDLLDVYPADVRLRRRQTQAPKLWVVLVHGSGRDFMILWDDADDGRPWVRYAGAAF